jgi:hypothetical protein
MRFGEGSMKNPDMSMGEHPKRTGGSDAGFRDTQLILNISEERGSTGRSRLAITSHAASLGAHTNIFFVPS